MDMVMGELSIVQNEKAVLESKLDGYEDVIEEVSTLKEIVASLELEKTELVDKIAMLEHVVQKLKGDLNESTLRNMDLRTGCEMMNTDFHMEFDFPLTYVDQLRALIDRAGGNGTSKVVIVGIACVAKAWHVV
ncbi:unnamed protein product [Lactuca saligna]|uniref:Uncharacterized protein n=1 Tax=Lactuca saligna TaxID=75948 RepID=A0AA35ZYM0_LACSI|nr:unnamed protein product [Lactuca saligna]